MGTFIFRLNRNGGSSIVLHSEVEDEEEAYKCEFCDIIFLRLESIMRHNKYFCPKRRKLPRSCTVTTSMLSGTATSFNSQHATDENSGSQSLETTTNADICSQTRLLAQLGEHTFSEDLGTAREKPSTSTAKRKRSSDEQEPTVDEIFSTQEKVKKFSGEIVVASPKTEPVDTGL